MRRSYAPSQVKQRASLGSAGVSGSRQALLSAPSSSDSDEVTIQRLPLFGFLSIPNDLKRQFKIPSGCVISEENIALRKRKTLGQRRVPLVVPGGYVAPLPRCDVQTELGEDDVDEDGDKKGAEFPPHEPVILWRDPDDETNVVQVIPQLASRLRPHQREGVQFLFECTMGLRGFEGEGCILADDMGLGKTLMSITLLWTLLNQGFSKKKSAVQKAIVVCPTSLVGNWENELRKWIGDHCPTFAVKSDPKKMIKNFICHRGKGILIISYETQRRYSDKFTANSGKGMGGFTSCCELLICDEAHKLKNAESGLSKSLNLLPARKRVLLSGTPMQNELTEFFNMVNFCNPDVLGTLSHFRKKYENPILRAREPDASTRHIEKAEILQKELSTIVNEFILKRGNILNAQHLPPKLVQFVCCKLTPLQERLYECVLNSKESRHLRDGKQTNTLNSLRHMLSICSHPDLILSSYRQKQASDSSSPHDEVLEELYGLMHSYNEFNSISSKKLIASPSSAAQRNGGSRADRAAMRKIKMSNGFGGMSCSRSGFDPERSGKFLVLFRLMSTLRNTCRDRIVIVSNTTQTLDLVEAMCNDNNWPQLRLDGSVSSQKRTKLVDNFNDPSSNSFAFLLSSKAGGCGINLIGGNRLVMMDPDWNPASDKQAAARIWREGQRKRCYIYRLMSTCTIEEKIIQRQLSKEGLQSIVDNTDQVNTFSSNELKSLFQRDNVLDTRSNTHDTLRCKRCKCVTKLSSNQKNGKNVLLREHADVCKIYLTKIIQEVEQIVALNTAAKLNEGGVQSDWICENEYTSDIIRLKEELMKEDTDLVPYKTLPELSKRIRSVVVGVDKDLKDVFGVQNVTLFNDFVASWTDLVPTLQEISKSQQYRKKEQHPVSDNNKENSENSGPSEDENSTEEGEGVEDDYEDEYVEQEGCPEEEDFNRWSHHSSVRTCYGDESLQKAMSMGDNDDHGDNTISFVFGLEVNWDLLQQKLAQNAERDEQRKLQVEEDLRALNKARDEVRRRAECNKFPEVHNDFNNATSHVENSIQTPIIDFHEKGQCTTLDRNEKTLESDSDEDSFARKRKIKPSHGHMDGDLEKKKSKNKKLDECCTPRVEEVDKTEDTDSDDCFDDDPSPNFGKNIIKKEKTKSVKRIVDSLVDSDSDVSIADHCDASSDAISSKISLPEGTCGGVSPDSRSCAKNVNRKGENNSLTITALLTERHDDITVPLEFKSHDPKGSCSDSPPSSQLSWTCVSCTFLNTYPSRLCDVCGCRKPRTETSFSQGIHGVSHSSGGRNSSNNCSLRSVPDSSKSKGRLALPGKRKGMILSKK